MTGQKRIKSALISVFYKDGLEQIARNLYAAGITLYSTGGTRTFLENLGMEVVPVEDLTSFPSILGGRVKTLHPKIFGGILSRRDEASDIAQLEEYDIPEIDLVIVDLYPFEETLASGAEEQEIIEKIDIGGVSLIRAAAKNFNDVLIVASTAFYPALNDIIENKDCSTSLNERKSFAAKAFRITSDYDTAISRWFGSDDDKALRYGENPHQTASFNGKPDVAFTQLHGKELSYNNLLDVDSAMLLMEDFPSAGCAIIKHNNACGAALDPDQLSAWKKSLAGDPLSAFGGIFIFNTPLEAATAAETGKLFFEIIIAPGFSDEALSILKSKKNRIILKSSDFERQPWQVRTVLNGVLVQQRDTKTETMPDFKQVTEKTTIASQADLEFAAVLVKHTKSNAIVLVKNGQLLASGTGQTSRVDALNQAVQKATRMGFLTRDAVLASDAFFPFTDCVELAAEACIETIIQPGGSVKDQDVIAAANNNGIAMIFTGIRHFKH